ncbi:MAG: D-alanyl-D-alanine carboxypeptidase/D-alanyl-D-alanine-endopeptidase, partial [Saprospiraceae bacterium]|nr:D-alanyl-D-alanine carboxypeptidase/D-alanyl-D-alanine-endopeptidase [Saprospiraceae bacterium]
MATFCGQLCSQTIQSTAGIDRFVQDKDLVNANISISVNDAEDGTLIVGYRPHKVLVPASSLKLLTTLTALKILGEDFKFESLLQYSGEIKADGTLVGDLYFVGSGDPSFGSDRLKGCDSFEQALNKIVDFIKQAGITCIKGEIIIDESIFDSYPVAPSWQWNDLGNYYASGAWGINVNENLYY